MLTFLLGRLLQALPTFVGITIVTFAVVHWAPGDPAAVQLDGTVENSVGRQAYETLRAHFGLDQPFYIQYARWLGRICTLDFGNSFADGRPVSTKIGERLPWTLSLAAISMIVGLMIAIPVGLYGAARRGSWLDRMSGGLMYALYSLPNYVAAMAVILAVVTFSLEWLPLRGATSDQFERLSLGGKIADLAKHYVLITLCSAYGLAAFQTRFIRANVLETLGQDYIRTARAKGLSEYRVVVKHAFRNALLPLVTLLGVLFPALVSGAVVLEVIFSWPGLGRLMFDAMLQRDYPTVMALSTLTAVLVLAGTLLADVCYGLVDPRVSHDR